MAFLGGVVQWNSSGGVDAHGEWLGKSSLLWAFPIVQTFASLRALFITRKESFVSLLKQRTFEVGTSRILCNWACWLHPSLHIWCEPQLCKSSLCHPKIFCDLAGWQFFFFLNVILNLQKRETRERRLSIRVHLETHIQLQDTIHYCSDTSPAVINRTRMRNTPDEGRVHGGECQLLFLSKVLLKDQYYFLFHWLNLKNNCERAA